MKKVYVLLLTIFVVNAVWGQQVIGPFPEMDGGYENQTAGALTQLASLATGAQSNVWTINSTTTTVASITATGGRSGPKYVTFSSTTLATRRLQSPTASNAAITNATAYTLQYFYKTAAATNPTNTGVAINWDGTGTSTVVGTAITGTTGVWAKVTTSVTTGSSAASPRYGLGQIRYSNLSAVSVDYDDFVIYAGAVDNAAPNSPGAVTVNNPTSSSLDVSWVAASGGVDGGGYVVVRYGALPGVNDDPNQNGIYASGNSVPGGVTGTVVYIGTGLSFTDNSLSGGTTYYYKVYTADKAFNYSPESQGSGVTSAGVADIALASLNPAVAAGNISQNTTNNVIYLFSLAVTTQNATLSGVTINTAGTYISTDISNLKCWYSADNIFNSATDVLLSTKTTGLGAGTQVFPTFTNQVINNGSTGYIFITIDASCATTVTNTISVNAITTADISFLSGNKTGTAFAADLQTFIASLPVNITIPAASVANMSSNLTWANPTGCYDEVLIVASAAAPNSGTPVGNGTAYTALPVFGTGTALGNGFVVYKGNTSGQLITGLTNGTLYYYKFFTRYGSTWSSGVEISQTPAAVTAATDYFRSVASGDWSNIATWESSPDSVNWIAATATPLAASKHVVVQNPNTVNLLANQATSNLTILSGAGFTANAFAMVVSNRFNLLGTASFFQGGSIQAVPGIEQVLATTSNYYFNGTQAGTTGSYPAFGNLFWQPNASGNATFQNSVTAAPFNLGLVIRGNMTINLQNATPTEIRFTTGASISRSHTIDGNLNIISANSKVVVTNGSILIRATLNVGGNINISAGILQGTSSTAATDGSASLNLGGNINNTGGIIQTGNSTTGIFSLNYVGTGAQSINNTSGTITFSANQLDSINKASGALTLNTPITHAGTIRFIRGVVNTSAVNLLTLTASAVVLGASNASFVNGPVSKIGNTLFTFPVGKTNCGVAANKNGYAALVLSNFVGGSLPTDKYTAEYIRGNASAMGGLAVGLDHVSACDYWTLDVVGAPTVDLTLSWKDSINNCTTASPYVNNLPALVVAHFNGTTWNTFGATSTALGTPASGTVVYPGVSVFSPFAIGSIDFSNPLPITINYFTGTKSNGNHLLDWKVTCVSVPSATIEMQRSTDGRNYSSIYSIFATALRCQQPFNYTDAQPEKGINYYRLKMTDADGKITYSTVVPLINAVKEIDVMNIAPNPVVNSAFNLQISSADKTQIALVITDMQGRIVRRQSVNLIAGFNTIPMNVKNLAAGTYQLFGYAADEKTRALRFVIQ